MNDEMAGVLDDARAWTWTHGGGRPIENYPQDDEDEVHAERDLVVDGFTFLFGGSTDTEPRWGTPGEVLWPRGESLMIVSPPGIGKTTMGGLVLGGLVGAWPTVLGLPLQEAGRVLYLAMDRPRQISRSLQRQFSAITHQELLRERVVVRRGPLPADLGKQPDQLLTLARIHDADVVVIDSLKDAVTKLSDDEAAGNFNRAVQMCNTFDVDVMVLHHQRKGQGGSKPTTLEDVYGNTWLTAGAGSVILLWGEPGSELVELSHLKAPADPIGPWNLEFDHHVGSVTIARGFDVVAFLRMRGAQGATVADAAQAEHGSPQKPGGAAWKRTERRLRALVRDGAAMVLGQSDSDRDGGQFGTSRYHLVESQLTVDNHRGQAA